MNKLDYLKEYDFEQHCLTGNWNWSGDIEDVNFHHFYKEIYLYTDDRDVEFVFYLGCGFDKPGIFYFKEQKIEKEHIPENIDIYNEARFIGWLRGALREHERKYKR